MSRTTTTEKQPSLEGSEQEGISSPLVQVTFTININVHSIKRLSPVSAVYLEYYVKKENFLEGLSASAQSLVQELTHDIPKPDQYALRVLKGPTGKLTLDADLVSKSDVHIIAPAPAIREVLAQCETYSFSLASDKSTYRLKQELERKLIAALDSPPLPQKPVTTSEKDR